MTPSSTHRGPDWARRWLIAAGFYNLLWGGAVIVFPALLFELAAMEPPRYPQIWQCVGMIVGVYGIGYLVASRDPRRHWPIVLVGLLGKVLGPVGFWLALVEGELPLAFGATIITNDLVWWVPFSMMLWDAARAAQDARPAPELPLREALERATDQQGRSLMSLSREAPTLVVLTRHAGCTFCQQMLADLAEQRDEIRRAGLGLAIVTMSDPQANEALAKGYGLGDASWVSDREKSVYRAFEVGRGSFGQLFGPRVWWRGLVATLNGHVAGKLRGDGFQMPGAFVVESGRIVRAHRHASAGERLDYAGFACHA